MHTRRPFSIFSSVLQLATHAAMSSVHSFVGTIVPSLR
jgi:hypothetical protein